MNSPLGAVLGIIFACILLVIPFGIWLLIDERKWRRHQQQQAEYYQARAQQMDAIYEAATNGAMSHDEAMLQFELMRQH